MLPCLSLGQVRILLLSFNCHISLFRAGLCVRLVRKGLVPLYHIGGTIVPKTLNTLCDTQTRFESEQKTSQMHENDQATIKTRYCGRLYSPLLRKWTHLDHREWVSYYMGEG